MVRLGRGLGTGALSREGAEGFESLSRWRNYQRPAFALRDYGEVQFASELSVAKFDAH